MRYRMYEYYSSETNTDTWNESVHIKVIVYHSLPMYGVVIYHRIPLRFVFVWHPVSPYARCCGLSLDVEGSRVRRYDLTYLVLALMLAKTASISYNTRPNLRCKIRSCSCCNHRCIGRSGSRCTRVSAIRPLCPLRRRGNGG
jgi:hypothetical protein